MVNPTAQKYTSGACFIQKLFSIKLLKVHNPAPEETEEERTTPLDVVIVQSSVDPRFAPQITKHIRPVLPEIHF